jgi:hypothetical protein
MAARPAANSTPTTSSTTPPKSATASHGSRLSLPPRTAHHSSGRTRAMFDRLADWLALTLLVVLVLVLVVATT